MSHQAPYNDDPYPNKGYLFNEDGTHHGGDVLENREQLYRWLWINEPIAMETKRELMVTDNEDYCVYHVKDGVLLWPNDSLIPPNQEVREDS